MRFMLIVKASEASEAGELPPKEAFDAMGRYNEELVKAGVLLAADGLQPSSMGARIDFTNPGKPAIIDGPFTETKELIAGYWLIQVASRDEALAWAVRAPFGGGVLELRQVHEVSDFPPDAMSPEAAERDRRLREQLSS